MDSRNLIFAILFGVSMFQDIFTPEKMHVSAVMLVGKETDFRDSTESLDQIGTTVEYAVNLNKTLNTTLDDSSGE